MYEVIKVVQFCNIYNMSVLATLQAVWVILGRSSFSKLTLFLAQKYTNFQKCHKNDQSDHSTLSNMADWYCEKNMYNSYIQALCVYLEFPKEVPMGKHYVQFSILGDTEKFGHDPASRPATCSQVIKVYKTYW